GRHREAAEKIAKINTEKKRSKSPRSTVTVTKHWLLSLLEVVNFKRYGLTDETVTKLYCDCLEQLPSKARRTLENIEGPFAVKSEAAITVVDVNKFIAKKSAWAIENFGAYVQRTFRYNLLKAIYKDETRRPEDIDTRKEWGRKLDRSRK